jgi:hypothetical protein
MSTTETPLYASIEDWCKLTGMGRTNTYRHLALGNLTAKKLGRSTLIDVPSGLAWLRSLPDARISTGA